MRILVLGKSGYISTCFQVYMMNNHPEIQVDAISARNDGWKKISFNRYDVVFNTVGLAHNNARAGTESEFISLNVDLPFQLAQKAKNENVRLFIHMSSMIVYGNQSKIGCYDAIDENTIPNPMNIYGKSKLLGEKAILKLSSEGFNVAIIRSSLVYGEHAVDNFEKLLKYALRFHVFPNIPNYRSMIYSDNLCELVHLIAQNNAFGFFYPQQEKVLCISQFVKDIGYCAGHKIVLTKIFNPIIKVLSNHLSFLRRIFGNEAYKIEMSNHFDGSYRVVSYEESIRRIIELKP